MNKNRIRLTESQLHKVIKESVKRVLKESVSLKSTKESLIELCNDCDMDIRFGKPYNYDGIPTLLVFMSAQNVDEYDFEEISDYLEHYDWVSPPIKKFAQDKGILIIKGEVMPS